MICSEKMGDATPKWVDILPNKEETRMCVTVLVFYLPF